MKATDKSKPIKCRCNGSRGTDCDWCQGTGYIIESLHLIASKPHLTDKNEPQVKHQSLHSQFEKINNAIANLKKDNDIPYKTRTSNNSFSLRSLYVVAKEFNIGMETITDFFSQKGDNIESNPATELTEKMYDALREKFGRNKRAKHGIEHKILPKGTTLKNNKIAKDNKKIKNAMKTTFILSDLIKWEENLRLLKNKEIHENETQKNKKKSPVITKKQNKKTIDNRFIKGNKKPKQFNNSSINTPTKKPILNPDFEISDSKHEYKEERKLDASGDYYQFREQGKFGSHSMHDNMGDEANP